MRPLLFKVTIIFLLISTAVAAQKKNIYKKSFPTTEKTMLNLDLTNSTISIETSSDDQIHVEFSADFQNYPKKRRNEIIDEIDIAAMTRNDIVELRVFSKTKLSREHYVLNSKNGIVLDDFKFGIQKKREKKDIHKSQASILKEVQSYKKGGKGFLDRVKVLDENGKKQDIDKKTLQLMKNHFVIKIPKHIYVRIKGMETEVFIEDDLYQKVDINLTKGLLRAKKIENSKSFLNVIDANVYVESIAVQNLGLKNVSKSLFGSIKDTHCHFMGSKVELGFIGKGVKVQDYNSKIFFYNFDKKFEELKFRGEYTELFVFDYDDKIQMKAKGKIALMYDGFGTISSRNPLKGVKPQTSTLELEEEAKENTYGNVEVLLEKGVLRIITEK